MDVEEQVIFNLWSEMQNYITNMLVHQDLTKGMKEIGDDFEKLIHRWVRSHRTLRLTYDRKRGFSGTRHGFDIIVAIPLDAKTRNDGLLLECKTLYIKRLCKKGVLTGEDARSVLLTRESVMTFLMKCYDACPEGFFDTMLLDKVYPVIVSTKPLTRDAFKFATTYGVTVIQPMKDTFFTFLKQLMKHHNIDLKEEFYEEIKRNGAYYPPLHVLNAELQTLISRLESLDKKDEMDILRLRARAKELGLFIKRQKREIGILPKRGKEFLDLHSEIYLKYLDHVRQVGVLKNEILQKY